MSRGLLVILGLIGAALIVLIVNHDSGTSFGMDNDRFGSLVYAAIWGSVVAAGIVGSGMRFGEIARQLLVWLVIILALVAGYQYRYELQDVASRMTAGLVPGSPLSTAGEDGRVSVMVEKASNGHFQVEAVVNGAAVSMLVDTGASTTVLTEDDARSIGIDVSALQFVTPVSTANGTALAAMVTLDEIAIGDIRRERIRAMVAQPGRLDESLLGMTFLESLTGFDVRGDRLILRD